MCDDSLINKIFTAYNLADAVLQFRDWRINPTDSYDNLISVLPSTNTKRILQARSMLKELEESRQLKTVADEMYINKSAVVMMNDKNYSFANRKVPRFKKAKSLLFTTDGIIVDEFDVIGTYKPTSELDKFRIVKLVHKFQELIERGLDPIPVVNEHTEAVAIMEPDEVEAKPYEILSYYIDRLQELVSDCTVDEIFSTDSDVSRIITDLVSDYLIHEFS